MTKEEKLLTLDEAQESFMNAIELVESAVGDNSYIKAYWIDHANIMAASGHGFLSRDLNLDEIKTQVENGEA